MKKHGLLIFFIASLFLLLYSYSSPAANADCDIDKGACSRMLGNAMVIFDIQPKPVKAMRELNVDVLLKGMNGHEMLRLNFDMPGMYMGKNEVILKRVADGKYTGKGVIPRCPSGKRLWRATVEIPDTGKAEFIFNVNY